MLRMARTHPTPSTILMLVTMTMGSFAGCAQLADQAASPLGIHEDDVGAVVGRVLDDAALPLEGALVVVVDTELRTITGADGSFALRPLEPGDYVVVAQKEGYATVQTVVAVAESAQEITLTLTPVATDVPYYNSQVFTTFVICASRNLVGGTPCTKLVDYATGTNISGTEKFAFPFVVPAPDLVNVRIEMNWKTQSTGSDMLFKIQTPPNQPLTAATVSYFTMEGGPPLRGWLQANAENQGNARFDAEPNKITYEALTIWDYDNATVPYTSVYINHRTDTWLTWFYNRAGPRDFTILPDE